MEVRIFQIVVPVIVLLYLFIEVKKVINNHRKWIDLTPHFILITMLLLVSIFPDWTTNKLATLLGFESNINAILFTFLGILSLFILHLFDKLRMMKAEISKLTIECSILREKMNI